MAHLPDALVERLLSDDSFQPGGRPSHFRAVVPDSVADVKLPPSTIDHPGPAAGWIFKETAAERQRRRHSAADRWRNCGGVAGARDLPAARPVLRRRYGKLTPAASNAPLLAWCAQPCQPGEKRTAAHRTTRPTAKEGFAYHEYTLLDRSKTRPDGAFEDNVSAYLFHVVPVRDAMAVAPRLGLPESITLTVEEARSLSAILRVEGFGEIPGLESVGSMAQLANSTCATYLCCSNPLQENQVLPTEEVIRRICDTSYEPGHRPGLLKPAKHGWLFKEPGRPARLRRGQHEDRWKHSGGQKGAKDLCLAPNASFSIVDANTQAMCSRPVVRRRNGVIQPPGKPGFTWRYHQYTLLTRKVGANGEEEWEEDNASPILFHVQPPDRKPPPKAANKPTAAFSQGYQAELLGGPSTNNSLTQEIPTFNSELIQSLPSLRSSASSRKRKAPTTAPVVQAVKRSAPVAVGTRAAQARVVPVVNTVVVSTASAVPTGAPHQQSSEPTSLQDAIKFLEWWQPGESQMHNKEDFSTFRRTRSSFMLPVSSGPSNELSALPSFGWLGPSDSTPTDSNMLDEPIKTGELAMLP